MPTAHDPSHSQVREIIRLRSLRGVGLYQEGFNSGCYLCRYLFALHPDCVSIFLGFGVRDAMQSRPYVEQQTAYGSIRERQAPALIRRVHSVILKDVAGFGFGSRCLEFSGEP